LNFVHGQDLFENEKISEPKFNQQIFNSIKQDYNFDSFIERNKEIHKKGKTNIEKNNRKAKTKDEFSEEDEGKYIDEKTLAKLQEYIKNDKDNKSSQYKPINPQDEEITQSESADIEKDILVNRPQKNFVWGLGNQTKQKKCTYLLYKFFS
jgi:hypothetical protein